MGFLKKLFSPPPTTREASAATSTRPGDRTPVAEGGWFDRSRSRIVVKKFGKFLNQTDDGNWVANDVSFGERCLVWHLLDAGEACEWLVRNGYTAEAQREFPQLYKPDLGRL
jgi:hypothetical protein